MALNDNLVAAWDFSTGSGTTIVDVINSITLTLTGATFDSGGLLCDANGEYAGVTAPATLKITGGALSFGFNCNILSAPPANYASWMGCGYNDTHSNPYWAYALIKNDSGNYAADFNNAGTYTQFATSTNPATGAQNFLVVVANGLRTIYRNGTELTTGATSAVSAPTYDTTAIFGVGDLVGGRNINTRFFQAYVWNADKSADLAAYAADPSGATWAFAASGPTISSVSPAAGFEAGGNAVTITGTGFDDTGGSSENVTFDGNNATGITFVNSTTITCTVPAGTAGAVDVVVTNGDASDDTLAGGYTYLVGDTLTQAVGLTNPSGQFATEATIATDHYGQANTPATTYRLLELQRTASGIELNAKPVLTIRQPV